MTDFEDLLNKDKLLKALIVQNSRQYAQKSAIAAGGPEVKFPKPDLPRAVPYDYNLAYSALLSEMEKAFEKRNPLFVLPMYYPLAYSTREDIDNKLENRQKQVVGLIRTVFLKRFESSIAAFAGSCADLAMKIAQWILDNSSSMPQHAKAVESWAKRNKDLLEEVHELFRPGVDFEELQKSDDDDEDLFGEVGVNANDLDPSEFDLDAMFEAAFEDLLQLTSFMERTVTVGQMNDDKFQKLKLLLMGGKLKKTDDPLVFDPAFTQQKVLVFTEYADTARYLHTRLLEEGLVDVDRLDGSRKADRVQMIRRFSPHYNRVDVVERAKLAPLRVLISTDVLAEGVNLQDASLIVNYDIHWNPVRLMQRIGRVDRRLDVVREKAIIAENPKTKKIRGTIQVRNFLPPDDLNKILSLYNRVQNRVLLISKTLGIPGGRLLTEEDMLDDVKVFNAFIEEYMGDVSPTEALRLRYLDLISQNPGLEEVLDEMPLGVHTARTAASSGLFACSVEPIRLIGEDDTEIEWTLAGGTAQWAMRRPNGEVTSNLAEIDEMISCDKSLAGEEVSDRVEIRNLLKKWQQDRRGTLMKDNGLPLDAPGPMNVCWMELK
jgi:hypothetical protein